MDWGTIIDLTVKQFFGTQAMYFALAAIGLNIHFGYTGLLNFGHAGFLLVGAYGFGMSIALWDLPLPVAVVIGLLAAVGFALILGVPTLRLRADYLAIVTIAASEIIRLVVRTTALRDYTGGSNGIQGFSSSFQTHNPFSSGLSIDFGWFVLDIRADELWVLTVGWILVLLSVLVVWLLVRSPWGLVLKAVREDEDAARALGKNAYAVKMQALVLGGLFGALGGIMYALGQGSVQPTPQDLGTPKTFFIWVALIFGGTGKLWGPVIGSMLFSAILSFTDTSLRQAVNAGHIPEWLMDGVQVGQVRFVLLGVGLMLLMVYRPEGLFGDRREMALDAH